MHTANQQSNLHYTSPEIQTLRSSHPQCPPMQPMTDSASYSQALRGNKETNSPDDPGTHLTILLQELKTIFSQIIHQNSLILNMLTTVINTPSRSPINSLRIAAWNANGLLNHKPELIQFLHDTNTDIVLISETHFTNKTVFKIPNYIVYHCNHPNGSAHGGAAVIVRAALRHYEAPPYRTDKIQAAVLNIHDQPWSFNVAALYSPSRHSIRTDE